MDLMTTPELEDLALEGLQETEQPVSEVASENLVVAMNIGLIMLEKAGLARLHVQESMAAGRLVFEETVQPPEKILVGAVA